MTKRVPRRVSCTHFRPARRLRGDGGHPRANTGVAQGDAHLPLTPGRPARCANRLFQATSRNGFRVSEPQSLAPGLKGQFSLEACYEHLAFLPLLQNPFTPSTIDYSGCGAGLEVRGQGGLLLALWSFQAPLRPRPDALAPGRAHPPDAQLRLADLGPRLLRRVIRREGRNAGVRRVDRRRTQLLLPVPARMKFWIGVIALIVLGVWWIWRHGGWGAERESPLEVLDRRYAAGQIDQEEYEERRRVLSGSGDR